jgi:hypothetical protein
MYFVLEKNKSVNEFKKKNLKLMLVYLGLCFVSLTFVYPALDLLITFYVSLIGEERKKLNAVKYLYFNVNYSY